MPIFCKDMVLALQRYTLGEHLNIPAIEGEIPWTYGAFGMARSRELNCMSAYTRLPGCQSRGWPRNIMVPVVGCYHFVEALSFADLTVSIELHP